MGRFTRWHNQIWRWCFIIHGLGFPAQFDNCKNLIFSPLYFSVSSSPVYEQAPFSLFGHHFLCFVSISADDNRTWQHPIFLVSIFLRNPVFFYIFKNIWKRDSINLEKIVSKKDLKSKKIKTYLKMENRKNHMFS